MADSGSSTWRDRGFRSGCAPAPAAVQPATNSEGAIAEAAWRYPAVASAERLYAVHIGRIALFWMSGPRRLREALWAW